jgi:MFS family permease
MLGITLSTNLAGRSIERTGRYKRFPIAGLAVMAAALGLLAVAAGHPSRAATALISAMFGLGFGVVGQVLIVAVQNGVEQRELGVAMATTNFFRAIGGAVGAAVLGAIFAARAGISATEGTVALGPAARADLIDGVQTVFLVAAPIALLALLVVLRLREVPLQARGAPPGPRGGAVPAGAGR